MANNQGQMGLIAYNFEPTLSEEEISERNRQELANEAAAPLPVEEWCQCGKCQQMPVDECVCCRDSDLVLPNLEDHECITNHESYNNLILNPEVLSLAYIQMMMFKGQHGRAPDELNNRQSRLVAYRQFVCWMLRGERLGKGKRVVIPSCVVKTIREAYPDPNNDYTGFKLALESAHDLFH